MCRARRCQMECCTPPGSTTPRASLRGRPQRDHHGDDADVVLFTGTTLDAAQRLKNACAALHGCAAAVGMSSAAHRRLHLSKVWKICAALHPAVPHGGPGLLGWRTTLGGRDRADRPARQARALLAGWRGWRGRPDTDRHRLAHRLPRRPGLGRQELAISRSRHGQQCGSHHAC